MDQPIPLDLEDHADLICSMMAYETLLACDTVEALNEARDQIEADRRKMREALDRRNDEINRALWHQMGG